jgi:uncharacterized protein (DUF427 family)
MAVSLGNAPGAAVLDGDMTDQPVLQPSAEHPITITPTAGRVVVRVHGVVVADTRSALTLQESTYPPVQYIPLADVDRAVLTDSDTTTYCPYKGRAGYFGLAVPGLAVSGPDDGAATRSTTETPDAVWFYAQPYPAVAPIAGHVAFYPDKAEISVTAE